MSWLRMENLYWTNLDVPLLKWEDLEDQKAKPD